MFQIRYEIDDIDEFIRRGVGDQQVKIDERDRILAAATPTLDDVWFAGEPYGTLWIDSGQEAMEVYAYGATVALYELKRAIEELAEGSDAFEGAYLSGGYGVALRIARDGDRVRATRIPHGEESGPDFVAGGWLDFVRAVDDYAAWYHTEYLAEASWLLRVEDIQQLRRDAGYPPDHL